MDITCYNCNKKGHISRKCPDKEGGQGGGGPKGKEGESGQISSLKGKEEQKIQGT